MARPLTELQREQLLAQRLVQITDDVRRAVRAVEAEYGPGSPILRLLNDALLPLDYAATAARDAVGEAR